MMMLVFGHVPNGPRTLVEPILSRSNRTYKHREKKTDTNIFLGRPSLYGQTATTTTASAAVASESSEAKKATSRIYELRQQAQKTLRFRRPRHPKKPSVSSIFAFLPEIQFLSLGHFLVSYLQRAKKRVVSVSIPSLVPEYGSRK